MRTTSASSGAASTRTRSAPGTVVAAHREAILAAARGRHAVRVRLFGSVARGEARSDSDVDLLVDFAPGTGLLDHAGLWAELDELLPVRVDVIDAAALDVTDERHRRILADAVDL